MSQSISLCSYPPELLKILKILEILKILKIETSIVVLVPRKILLPYILVSL